jgi:adenine-specific DNA methylase
MTDLIPFALNDAPALIEAVFPAQKVSFEAQSERKAVAAQTLTGLGSYWKGRKPLILVRAIVLGSLLPQTGDAEKDLEIFEKLMGFDDEGLARRALSEASLKASEIAMRISLSNPWDFFKHSVEEADPAFRRVAELEFPLDREMKGFSVQWRRDVTDDDKLTVYRRLIATFGTYEDKAAICKRPEEMDQEWLYAPVWASVNRHYADWGIRAKSIPQLVEQLGMLRYGHRPRVGDTFSGGGSIPFEAARMGCDAYAADLNPIACMLTWGALNVIGASKDRRTMFEVAQRDVMTQVDKELIALGVEHDDKGNRAKAYLYCLETECPETKWMVPMLPSRIISPKNGTIAKLKPDHANKRFEIEVVNDATAAEMKAAETGTVVDGDLLYELDGKTHRTPVKTLRGDYRSPDGNSLNKLRQWEKLEFKPQEDDVFQERLYAIQWITKKSIYEPRQLTYFRGITDADIERERKVEEIVAANLARWQEEGLAPDMAIEPGEKTDEPIRTRGWMYWHQLFNARQLLLQSLALKTWRQSSGAPLGWLNIAKMADFNAKLSRWKPSQGGGLGGPVGVFSNQALNTFYNYASRAWAGYGPSAFKMAAVTLPNVDRKVVSAAADKPAQACDLWVTDPPYADAVNYHEITEFFIAWLRKNPPEEFRNWTWDSRRALAIKGSGDDFRRGMVDAYGAMAKNMPDNGMQCVMFTHQDTNVWSDMVGIFWAAGLQVVAAWYIATETTSELKKGGYVQGTVILMLRKRPVGERTGFKQRILPAVRAEVERQIESMMHLNDEVKDKLGEPVFNDSDLQMAGYAAALKVLTAYTQIGGEDVTNFALRPRQRGEVTVVDEIVQQAAEAANSLLVPEGLGAQTWARLTGVERFFFRMMDMETTGAKKLDNYQNFAKAFRVDDYARIMGDMAANNARLKSVPEFASRDLTDSTEIGPTWLGQLIIGLQQLLAEVEPQVVIGQFQADLPEFMEARPLLIDMLAFVERKASQPDVRAAAEVLGARMKNLRALGQ